MASTNLYLDLTEGFLIFYGHFPPKSETTEVFTIFALELRITDLLHSITQITEVYIFLYGWLATLQKFRLTKSILHYIIQQCCWKQLFCPLNGDLR